MKRLTILICFLYLGALLLGGYKLIVALTHPLKYKNEIISVCDNYNLSPALVASVINVESGYNKDAISSKGAIGLMQIKQDTTNYLISYYKLNINKEDICLTDIKTNLNFGCLYLNYLNTKFKDTFTALAAYNAGETKVRGWLKDTNFSDDGELLKFIPYSETSHYIKKIKQNLKFYNKYF